MQSIFSRIVNFLRYHAPDNPRLSQQAGRPKEFTGNQKFANCPSRCLFPFLFLSRPIHRSLSASEFPEAKIQFSFLNPFVFSQALNDCRAATKEGRKRLGLTGFGLSQSFVVFKENTSRTTRSLGKLAREYNVTRVLQATRINTVCRQFSLSLSPLSSFLSPFQLYRIVSCHPHLVASQRLTIHNPLPLPILALIASVSLPSDTNRKRAKRNCIELPSAPVKSAKSIDIPREPRGFRYFN